MAYSLADGRGGGLYIAFNTSHKAQVVELPAWGGRAWQLVADSGQVSSFVIPVSKRQLAEICIADLGLVAMTLVDRWLAKWPCTAASTFLTCSRKV